MSLEEEELILKEVSKLIQKGAVSLVDRTPGKFISQLFVVPKSDGVLRPVVNLKALNKFIKKEHFKMECFHMIEDLVKQGDWVAKVDLKAAYFLVPIHQNDQRFTCFQWQSRTYQLH